MGFHFYAFPCEHAFFHACNNMHNINHYRIILKSGGTFCKPATGPSLRGIIFGPKITLRIRGLSMAVVDGAARGAWAAGASGAGGVERRA